MTVNVWLVLPFFTDSDAYAASKERIRFGSAGAAILCFREGGLHFYIYRLGLRSCSSLDLTAAI